jgi:His Kinase A (phospho-acceptor) domain/Histidine kinase-, DNA gyrase B-, and HSP90-like ATPase
MPNIPPSQSSGSPPPSMHPALSGADGFPVDLSIPTILVCPLPIAALAHEHLLPELSHELKTPLTGIMGLSQVIQRQNSTSTDRKHQYADLIYQKSQQLLLAVNDLLDLTQLSTHQFVLQLRPIELSAILNAANQTAQRSAGLEPHQSKENNPDEEPTEHWMIADPIRIEQLFTHLLGYLLLHSPPLGCVQIALQPKGVWIAVTLTHSSIYLSEDEQVYLGWPYQPGSSKTSAVSSRSGVELKFLLARQLAQLHGGEITCTSDPTSGTSITVLLPKDLSRTTGLGRSPAPIHLLLILTQRSTALHEVTQTIIARGEPVVVARSLPEAREKLQILSPTVLAIDSHFAEACGWGVIQNWLQEQSMSPKPTLVWMDKSPPIQCNDGVPVEVWPWPLAANRVLTTLKQLPLHPLPNDSPPAQPAPKSFTMLQIGSPAAIAAPESSILRLLTQLAQEYGCSVLAVDDADQADLLIRIWKPKIMICPGNIPDWIKAIPPTSHLLKLPLVVLRSMRHQQKQPNLGKLKGLIYPVPANLQPQELKILTDRLYQYLIETISGTI